MPRPPEAEDWSTMIMPELTQLRAQSSGLDGKMVTLMETVINIENKLATIDQRICGSEPLAVVAKPESWNAEVQPAPSRRTSLMSLMDVPPGKRSSLKSCDLAATMPRRSSVAGGLRRSVSTLVEDDAKACAEALLSALSSGEYRVNGFKVQDVRTFFRALDRRGIGKVNKREFRDGTSVLGIQDLLVEKFWKMADKNRSGTITEDGFFDVVILAIGDEQGIERSVTVSKLTSLTGIVGYCEEQTEMRRKSSNSDLRASSQTLLMTLMGASAKQKDNTLDVVMSTVIMLNALTIGASMDHDLVVFEIIDIVFTCCFLVELALKFYLVGFAQYFCSVMNSLDFLLIIADCSQLVLAKIVKSTVADETPPASMFRVVRLVRLARLARLVKLKIFEDLVAMISGMVGGMSTLLWSIALFVLMVYITSLLFREIFGRGPKVVEYNGASLDIASYFMNVPRAMLTVFRYFFGDFTAMDGISLLEAIQLGHGTTAATFVSVLFFIITIGVFNVIAAIFVESTLAAAYDLKNLRKSERMDDQLLWSSRISIIIRKLFEYNGTEIGDKLSKDMSDLSIVPVAEREFSCFIQDEVVIKALEDLEIDSADLPFLFDILDADNTGSIYVTDLFDGLQRLRGDPRRSDIITCDLMIRSMQYQMSYLVESMEAICLNMGLGN